jgi:hypothetical protein
MSKDKSPYICSSTGTFPHFPAFAWKPRFETSSVEVPLGERDTVRVADTEVGDVVAVILHADHQTEALGSATGDKL